MIIFFVACEPIGKQRPRVTSKGTYTPQKTVDLERLIGWEGKKAMAGAKPLEDPIALGVQVMFHYPASWSAKRRAAAKWKSSKPDLDNLVKLVKDALNRICWKDDAQIVKLMDWTKIYVADEVESGFLIKFEEIA